MNFLGAYEFRLSHLPPRGNPTSSIVILVFSLLYHASSAWVRRLLNELNKLGYAPFIMDRELILICVPSPCTLCILSLGLASPLFSGVFGYLTTLFGVTFLVFLVQLEQKRLSVPKTLSPTCLLCRWSIWYMIPYRVSSSLWGGSILPTGFLNSSVWPHSRYTRIYVHISHGSGITRWLRSDFIRARYYGGCAFAPLWWCRWRQGRTSSRGSFACFSTITSCFVGSHSCSFCSYYSCIGSYRRLFYESSITRCHFIAASHGRLSISCFAY